MQTFTVAAGAYHLIVQLVQLVILGVAEIGHDAGRAKRVGVLSFGHCLIDMGLSCAKVVCASAQCVEAGLAC